MYVSCPTYNIDTGKWSETEFETKKDFREYIDSQVKYPGEYNIKFSKGYWNKQADIFNSTGAYPKFVRNSLDFKNHWKNEKLKCAFDSCVIYISEEHNTNFAVPGMYYFYLNYCPIYDKLKGGNFLPDIYDGDLHYFYYLLRCVLYGKFGCVLKKRQSGYTLKNMAVVLLSAWFGKSSIAKVFAIDESAVEDSWNLMDTYKQHINKHTAWIRNFSPDKALDLQIKTKYNDGSTSGNLSIIKGFSTARDPSKGVGGNMKVLFGEEAGKNPTLDKTHNFVTSNVALGGAVTGLIIYSGAVGELTKCDPLKKFITKPRENDFLTCPNRIDDDIDFGLEVGFFAPEWWNFVSIDEASGEKIYCFDTNGNTNKEQALELIAKLRVKAQEASPEDFRYYCSQRPLSIKEAFDFRKESIFPQGLLTRQEYRIDRGDYPYTLHDIERGADGKPILTINRHDEITEFPYHPKKDIIPYGCIKVWEKPIPGAKWGTYLAAVDPIMVDITSTSESLFSVVIYRNLTEELYTEGEDSKVKLSGDRIVASYIGRKKDIHTTNEVAELLLEYYDAFAVVENNVENFVRHMISKQKQKYMATKSDLPFLKEIDTNNTSYQEYGVKTNPTMWGHYINKILEYIKEETGERQKTDGSALSKIYGVEKIPDKRLTKELLAFTDIKGNYDQIITFALVLALAKARQMNGLTSKVDKRTDIKVDKNLYKMERNLFKNIGKGQGEINVRPRQPFRNLV